MPIDAYGSVVRENATQAFDSGALCANRTPKAVPDDIAVRPSQKLMQPMQVTASSVDQTVRERGPFCNAGSQQWPPHFWTHARLPQARGWHLLNEVTYAMWAGATSGRTALQVGPFVTDKFDTLSITSLVPATSEAGVAGGVFTILEAAGTLHLTWKAGRKKFELDECKREHAQGHARFQQGDAQCEARIAWLLARKRELEAHLRNWQVDEASHPLPQSAHATDANALPRKLLDARFELRDTNIALEKLALGLIADIEHYILYEQAANELAQANDNVHTLGMAAARDVVIQLGGTGCNVASAVSKAGVAGVDLATVGVAGGAFSVAMGVLHMAAGLLAWHQSARRLDDIQSARGRAAEWRTPERRRQRVSAIADSLHEARHSVAASSAANRPAQVPGPQSAERAQQAESDKRADIQRANELVDILMHHRDKAFDVIETAERQKIRWAKVRVIYGAVSVAIGIGAILATTAFGVIAPVGIIVGAVALLVGTVWLVTACIRIYKDRRAARAQLAWDAQALAQAQHIVDAQREGTVEEMRNNKYLTIDVLLRALFDGERPVARRALWEILIGLEMDRALLRALELQLSVRLDEVYEDDRKTMMERMRCCASATDEAALKTLLEGMSLRSDDAVLGRLRRLFQDFIEGKTTMRLEYERRAGFFSCLAGSLPAWRRRKRGVGGSQRARLAIPPPTPSDPQTSMPGCRAAGPGR